MGKKYQKFSIKVEYLNGDCEDINLAGVGHDNYTKVLNVYRNVRDTYEGKARKIDFVGQTKDGELGVIFTKDLRTEIGNKDLKKNVDDIMKNISAEFQLLSNKFSYHRNMINILTKKQDVILHRLEHLSNNTDENKIELLDELINIRKERRWHKEQLEMLEKIANENNINGQEINYKHLSNVFNIKTNNKKYKELTFKEAERCNVYTEKVNATQKDLNKLHKTYGNVFFNEENNTAYAYNNAKKVI